MNSRKQKESLSDEHGFRIPFQLNVNPTTGIFFMLTKIQHHHKIFRSLEAQVSSLSCRWEEYHGWFPLLHRKSEDICKHTVAIFKVFINLHYSYRCWDKTFKSASKPTTVGSSFLNIIQSMDFMQDYHARLIEKP